MNTSIDLRLILKFVIVTFSLLSAATSLAQKKTESTTNLPANSPANLPVVNPPASPWSQTIQVMTRTDIADERQPRIFTNTIDYSLGYDFKPYSAVMILAYSFLNVGSEVDMQNSSGFGDIGLGIDRSLSLSEKQKIKLGFQQDLPTSEYSQKNSLMGQSTFEAFHLILPGWSLGQSFGEVLTYSYTWNTYYQLPTSNTTAPKHFIDYSWFYKISPWKGQSYGVRVGVNKSINTLDQEDTAWSIQTKADYKLAPKANVSIRYSNGSPIDARNIEEKRFISDKHFVAFVLQFNL